MKGWACIRKPPLERLSPLPDSLLQGVAGVGGAGGRGRRGAAGLPDSVRAGLPPCPIRPAECMSFQREDFRRQEPEQCRRQPAREGVRVFLSLLPLGGPEGPGVSSPGRHLFRWLFGDKGVIWVVVFIVLRIFCLLPGIACTLGDQFSLETLYLRKEGVFRDPTCF